MPSAFSTEEILGLLDALNDELKAAGIRGQINLVGGAVMCLAFRARESTRDLDASFTPSVAVLDAALRVSAKKNVPDTWLNDAAKNYMSDWGSFKPFLELTNLKVHVASPEYMLAMKCLAMRIGEGYQDVDDIRYLLRNLGIQHYDDATEILGRFYSLEDYPSTALPAVRELIEGADRE